MREPPSTEASTEGIGGVAGAGGVGAGRRSGAVAAGFLAAVDDWSPDEDELAWWLSIAGVQFAHRRLERAGQPGVLPWLDATVVLEAALAEAPARWAGGWPGR